MKWLRRLYRSARRPSSAVPQSRRRVRPCLEALESRLAPASQNVFLVPLTQPADGTHLHSLAAALRAAGTGGSITIEPGAVPNGPSSVTQTGITIQGDPNVPARLLNPFSLVLKADAITLTNLNLLSVQLGEAAPGPKN